MLLSCGSIEEIDVETTPDDSDVFKDRSKRKTIFGDGGLMFFGDDNNDKGGELGVNSFLWRASLDTISFMPVNAADPFGGVIITDWHANAEAPNERFKLNVYILGRTLRADGIRVAVFRQILNRAGQWQDASLPDSTKTKIEDAILTRARQLRNTAILQTKN
ncbi:MAG: hypothetical protein CBB68_08285 [Rhodospirillaceae bacterium TMED8]|nr:hypothetical protein [Magnetovibrio sp.]OUT50543.1 MAG: hypothetical protein CBB68_08285 [Rhodospirillaceae bacterium TMED8]